MKVIGTVGMPGSGKSVISQILKEKLNSFYIVMGDVIREEAMREGLEPNSTNLRKIMLDLRKREGNDIVAKRCIEKLKENEVKYEWAIIEGLRGLEELSTFRKHLNFLLIAVHASPPTRFNRLKQRGRSDDPQNREMFDKRDLTELKVGIGSVIALADHILVNEGSKEDLFGKIDQLLESVL
ncbi:AAA family ATPase [Candidatus Borrarchaeum sp.]|uniref:AAA family ATPase n=1 Tax=Candidatus Borrarchaeum sp. TaxID=2846742 RepID=UPI00257A826D|nr:AAA family ATPase [Candidatus Borrarchaeum sp.]